MSMTVADLKRWMKAHGKNEVDVASLTKTHPNTVIRYLSGKNVYRSTEAAFERLIREFPQNSGDPPKQATG